MSQSKRQYDIVLLGATGYTGKLVSEYISKALPTNLSWAIAGRSQQKLDGIANDLRTQYPDRKEPAVEVAQLKLEELEALANRTRVLLNTVGPYAIHGEPVVAACARQGTHYLDVTGEAPWVSDMIKKYDGIARSNGAVIISQIGIESVPSDILSYVMVNRLHAKTTSPVKEVMVSLHSIKGAPSGGTLATVINLFDQYSISQIQAAAQPGSMSPTTVAKSSYSPSILSRLSGVRTVPDLGTVIPSIQAATDVPLVHRSCGLYRTSTNHKDIGEAYGPKFDFHCYMHTRNTFVGALTHLAFTIGGLFLLLPPVRWLMARMVTQPGAGATVENSKHDFQEYRGLAISDSGDQAGKTFGRFRSDNNPYTTTAILMVEGAATLLYDGDKVPAIQMGGGYLTPATLGQSYVERLCASGITIETKTLMG